MKKINNLNVMLKRLAESSSWYEKIIIREIYHIRVRLPRRCHGNDHPIFSTGATSDSIINWPCRNSASFPPCARLICGMVPVLSWSDFVKILLELNHRAAAVNWFCTFNKLLCNNGENRLKMLSGVESPFLGPWRWQCSLFTEASAPVTMSGNFSWAIVWERTMHVLSFPCPFSEFTSCILMLRGRRSLTFWWDFMVFSSDCMAENWPERVSMVRFRLVFSAFRSLIWAVLLPALVSKNSKDCLISLNSSWSFWKSERVSLWVFLITRPKAVEVGSLGLSLLGSAGDMAFAPGSSLAGASPFSTVRHWSGAVLLAAISPRTRSCYLLSLTSEALVQCPPSIRLITSSRLI